jgi:hypothetical protein
MIRRWLLLAFHRCWDLTSAQAKAVDAWLEVIAYSGQSSAIDHDRTGDAVLGRVRQMSEELGRIALGSGAPQSLMLRVRLARSRAVSFVNDPSELIESLPRPDSQWSKDLRIAVAKPTIRRLSWIANI